MATKRQLTDSMTKQQEKEVALSQLQVSHESLIDEVNGLLESRSSSRTAEEIESRYVQEVAGLQKKVAKLTKKLKQVTNSLEIAQTAQSESQAALSELRARYGAVRESETGLRQELLEERQQTADASALMRVTFDEVTCLQNDIAASTETIESQTQALAQKRGEIDRLNDRLAIAVEEGERTTAQLQEAVREGVELRLRLDEMERQKADATERSEEQSDVVGMQLRELKAKTEKLQGQLTASGQEIQELETANEKLRAQLGQEVKLRKAADLARENALTNMKNAYTLVNAGEASRHEMNLAADKVSSELDGKIGELQKAQETIGEYERRTAKLTSDLELLKQRDADQKGKLKSTFQDLHALRESSMPKEAFRRKVEQLSEEKAKLIEELRVCQVQSASLAAQDEVTQKVLEQQQIGLAKAESELRTLSTQNLRLKRKLQRSGILTTGTESEVEDEKPCSQCSVLSETIARLEAANLTLEHETQSSAENIAVLKDCLMPFYSRLVEIAAASDNDTLLREAESAKAVFDETRTSLAEKSRAVFALGIAAIDSFIFSMAGTSAPDSEAKLLRSTISHLERKVANLQKDIVVKDNEVSQVQADLTESRKNKEKYDSDVEWMSHSVSAYRSSLQATQKQLSESERSRRQLEGRLAVSQRVSSKSETRTESDSEDLLRSDSSVALEVPQSRTSALSDSLALLELLCQ
jgi:chromosome segregation ATPase